MRASVKTRTGMPSLRSHRSPSGRTTENVNVLSECERGENFLLERFKEVLDQPDLPAGVRGLLSEEQNKVRANVDAVRSLRREREHVE